MGKLHEYHPWARALWAVCQGSPALDRVVGSVESFSRLLNSRVDLSNFFEDAAMPLEAGSKALAEMLGDDYKPPFSSFLLMVMDAGMAPKFQTIAEDFIRLVRDETGRARARLRSAASLEAAEVERIRAALTEIAGRAVVIEAELDENLIGGVQIFIEGRLIDGSVKGKLDRLRNQLLESEVSS